MREGPPKAGEGMNKGHKERLCRKEKSVMRGPVMSKQD